MIERFGSRDAYVAALRERLVSGAFSTELQQTLAEAFAREPIETDDSVTAHELRVGSWFLRDEDLPFFQVVGTLAPLLATLATTGVVAAPALTTGIVTLLASAWSIWRKGGRLTREQIALLGILDARGPLSERQLSEALIGDGVVRDTEAVRALLEQLKEVELQNGSTVALVRSYNALWRTVNI